MKTASAGEGGGRCRQQRCGSPPSPTAALPPPFSSAAACRPSATSGSTGLTPWRKGRTTAPAGPAFRRACCERYARRGQLPPACRPSRCEQRATAAGPQPEMRSTVWRWIQLHFNPAVQAKRQSVPRVQACGQASKGQKWSSEAGRWLVHRQTNNNKGRSGSLAHSIKQGGIEKGCMVVERGFEGLLWFQKLLGGREQAGRHRRPHHLQAPWRVVSCLPRCGCRC